MAKLVEGQLEYLQMLSDMAERSRTFVAKSLRDYVQELSLSQERFPDVIPRFAEIHPVMGPVIERDSGTVLQTLA